MNEEKAESNIKRQNWMIGNSIESKKKITKDNLNDIDKVLTSNQARKTLWKDVCNEYLEAFCWKHGYTYDKYVWVGDDPGTVANIGDLFVGMDDIRYDIDNNIPESCFEKWYWKNLEVYELTGCHYMNFSSFCMGATDNWPEERLDRVQNS